MRVRTFRSLLVVAIAALLAAACGSDDDDAADSSNTTVAEAPDLTSFCEAAASAQSLASGPVGDELPEVFDDRAESVMQTLEDEAPDEVRDSIGTIVSMVRANIAGAKPTDPSFTREPEFVAADHEADAFMLDNCDANGVEVSGQEHFFEGVPQTLPSGLTSFTLTNNGHHDHDLTVLRVNDDVDLTVAELVQLGRGGGANFTFAGQASAPAGGEPDTVFVNLEPGRYGVLCLVPDEDTGIPHVGLGMFNELVVN